MNATHSKLKMYKSLAAHRQLTHYEKEAAQERYWNERFTVKREENKYDYSYVPVELQQDDLCQICGNENTWLTQNLKNFAPCYHSFHEDCLLQWVKENKICPNEHCNKEWNKTKVSA